MVLATRLLVVVCGAAARHSGSTDLIGRKLDALDHELDRLRSPGDKLEEAEHADNMELERRLGGVHGCKMFEGHDTELVGAEMCTACVDTWTGAFFRKAAYLWINCMYCGVSDSAPQSVGGGWLACESGVCVSCDFSFKLNFSQM